MIRLDQISKQHGPQILFVEASAAIQRGEKVGLVGPNGAGKSTIFRLITRQESPDDGQISIERNVSIGYFSQDVGEMVGRPAVAEVMAGAGAVSEVAAELKHLEEALGDPARADEMDALLARFGDVQARFDNLGGYALEAKAREILAGLGFSQEMMDGDVGNLSGGWKMRVALARILLMRPDAMLLDEPSNHLDLESILWLEDFLRSYEGALVMTSHDRELMNRIVGKVIENRRRRPDQLLGQHGLLRAAARAERGPGAGRLRAPAGDAGQGDALHRALQGPGRQGVAGAVAGEEAGQDREGRAAQAPQDADLRVPALRPLRRGRGEDREAGQALWRARHLRRSGPHHPGAGSAGR